MKKEEIELRANKLRKCVLDMIDEIYLVLPKEDQQDERDYIDDVKEQMSDSFDVVNDLIDIIFCIDNEIIWENDRVKDSN
jgi:hypothetical protein